MPESKRTLLLCFIHGFKGDAETFYQFPKELRGAVSEKLPDDHVEVAVYPKYETTGDLAQCTAKFVEWLREQVLDIRKKRAEVTWPPNDRSVGVILVAHSMGGFVASDALFSILNDRVGDDGQLNFMFPLVQGVLAFDTPYNGLARSMYVYGGFSSYQKVSNVWNIMSAASAGLLSVASLGNMSSTSTNTLQARPATNSSKGWQLWQNLAVRSGAAGAIAAGGVAAYMNRAAILESAKNLNKNSLKGGYTQGFDMLGQGLAYINRDSLGQSFAWLSSHLKFVGALLKQQEMSRRLERLSMLEGVGIKDMYTSLGENGYWTGGYFVPERTFCAVPSLEQKSSKLFSRTVNTVASDEIKAHTTMFRKELNDGYEKMTEDAADSIVTWFHNEVEVADHPPPAPSPETTPSMRTEDGELVPDIAAIPGADDTSVEESPLDIAAAAAVALPEEVGDELDNNARQTYLRNLMRIAGTAGGGLKSIGSSSIGLASLWGGKKSASSKDDVQTDLTISTTGAEDSGVPEMPKLPEVPGVADTTDSPVSAEDISTASESIPAANEKPKVATADDSANAPTTIDHLEGAAKDETTAANESKEKNDGDSVVAS